MSNFKKLGSKLALAAPLLLSTAYADEIQTEDFSTIEGITANYDVPIVDNSTEIINFESVPEEVLYSVRAVEEYTEPTPEEIHELPGYYITDQDVLDFTLQDIGANYANQVINFVNNETVMFPENHTMNVYTTEEAPQRTGLVFNFPGGYSGSVDFNNSTINIGDGQFTTLNMTGDQGGKTISNLTTNGSVVYHYDGENVKTETVGSSYGRIIDAQNVTFDNLTHNISQTRSSHTFDLMGVDNVTIKNSNFNGYLAGLNQAALGRIGQDGWHGVYSEAIQIDHMSYSAAGVKSYTERPDLALFAKMEPNGKSSKNVIIENNIFGPYTGTTGDSIIKGTNNIVTAQYGATVGSHSNSWKDGELVSLYENITVKNNVFDSTVNPIWNKDFGTDRPIYPVHMLMANKEGLAKLAENSDLADNYFINISEDRLYGSGVPGAAYIGWYKNEDSTKNGLSYYTLTRIVENKEITDLIITDKGGVTRVTEGWRIREIPQDEIEETDVSNTIGANSGKQPVTVVSNGITTKPSNVYPKAPFSSQLNKPVEDGKEVVESIVEPTVFTPQVASLNTETVATNTANSNGDSTNIEIDKTGSESNYFERQTPYRSENKELPSTGSETSSILTLGAMGTVFGLIGIQRKRNS